MKRLGLDEVYEILVDQDERSVLQRKKRKSSIMSHSKSSRISIESSSRKIGASKRQNLNA